MTVLAVFPDVEASLCTGLESGISGLTAGTVTPADLQSHLPFARVLATGGRDDKVTDLTRLTVDVYGATRAQAKATAESVRAWVTADGGQHVGQVVIDQGTTDTKPVEVPWNDTVRRFVAAYSVTARRSA